MSSEIASSNPVVKAILEGTAPRPAQVAASRGVLPLPQTDILEILVGFFNGADAELKENARQTLVAQAVDTLEETIRSSEVAPVVLAYFADRDDLPSGIQETILTNINTPPEAIASLPRKRKTVVCLSNSHSISNC